MSIEFDELQARRRIPWYYKLIFWRRYRRSRLETVRKVGLEVIQVVNSAKVRYDIPVNDLPSELMDLDQLALRVYRLLGEKSPESVKENFFQQIDITIKICRIKKILPNLRMKLREFTAKKKTSEKIKSSKDDFTTNPYRFSPLHLLQLNLYFRLPDEEDLDRLLKICSESELTQLEENLIPLGDDKIILDILRKKTELEEKYPRAASKGSIGHDRFNVKTRRPSEWQAKVEEVMGQGRAERPPIFSTPRGFLGLEQ